MTFPARLLFLCLVGALVLVQASCSEDEDPMAAKGVPVELVGAKAMAHPKYVREIVAIFVMHCAGLRQYWPVVRRATADLAEGADIRRDVRRGWKEEVRLEIDTGAEGLPERYGYAANQKLVYYIGLGEIPGVVTDGVVGQNFCNMPVNKYFETFLPILALNSAKDRDSL